jgi:hypothetical protein
LFYRRGAGDLIASFDCLVSHFYKISRCLPRYIFRISTFALSVERFREEKATFKVYSATPKKEFIYDRHPLLGLEHGVEIA